jgi:hypothetical protein
MTTPADELKAAATRLRTLLADLGDCRGPWYVVNREQRPYPQRIDNIGVPYVVASTTTDPSHPPVIADYIVAMHPGVGAVLADWLDATVAEVAVAEGTEYALHTDGSDFDGWNAALTLARRINAASEEAPGA